MKTIWMNADQCMTLLKYSDSYWRQSEERIYTVPDTVTKIGYGAFYNVKELDQINIYKSEDLEISDGAFNDCMATINYIKIEKPISPTPTAKPSSVPTATFDPASNTSGIESFIKELLIISQFRVKLTAKNYVSLSWNKNKYATGYRIYRAKKKSGTYKMIKDLSGTAVAYTDKTAGKNKSYYYRMEAYKTLSGKTITGKRTSVSFVRIPAFTAPKIMIRKGKMGKIRFISIQFKKYKGKYADIYVAQGSNKFKKLKLVSNKIAKYKKKFKIQYKVKNKILHVRVRTFDKKKKKKYYSSFSKMVKIKV